MDLQPASRRVKSGLMDHSAPNANFPQTHWTLVTLVQGKNRKQAALALEEICRVYWYPIYAYLRRAGKGEQDAEDLTQMLFQKLAADEAILQVSQERGRLRSFLIGMLRQVISRQIRHERAEKRGGGIPHFSLDDTAANARYALEPVEMLDPERLYNMAWAQQLLGTVEEKLRASFANLGRMETYEILHPHLGLEETSVSFAELGTLLGSNANAARVLVHRLRRKFRDLLEDEIAKTVAQPEDIATELAWMREVLR
jgi:DNA-directed RNA polymerase specialized sigma24 family protein